MAGPAEPDFNPYSAPAVDRPGAAPGAGTWTDGQWVYLPTGADLPDQLCWRCGGTEGLHTQRFKLRSHSGTRKAVLLVMLILLRFMALLLYGYWHYFKGPFVPFHLPLCAPDRKRRLGLVVLAMALLAGGCGGSMALVSWLGQAEFLYGGAVLALLALIPLYLHNNLVRLKDWVPHEGGDDRQGTAALLGAGPAYRALLPQHPTP